MAIVLIFIGPSDTSVKVFMSFAIVLLQRKCEQLKPERFKTRAAHFHILRDERTGMQRETVGKSGCEAAS